MATFCPLLSGLIATIPLDFSEGRKSLRTLHLRPKKPTSKESRVRLNTHFSPHNELQRIIVGLFFRFVAVRGFLITLTGGHPKHQSQLLLFFELSRANADDVLH